MTREDMYQTVDRIRKELRQIRQETDSPAVDSCLRESGIYLYNALLYLGDPEEITPEEAF